MPMNHLHTAQNPTEGTRTRGHVPALTALYWLSFNLRLQFKLLTCLEGPTQSPLAAFQIFSLTGNAPLSSFSNSITLFSFLYA